ncbi:uncharacterized protein LOC116106913 isoform X2 [Pistacia vera]|uniref:uncharacterized protein LOC116106913 isoform X2 n=1 Tax=Pistacia vera TaxID=55513 RepID=UPI001262D6C2|nr:uncharacterized protein LOC116106913 isoform X2 [Pistacia vera]
MDERTVEFDPQQQFEVGRERISEGMKCLQDLVQWCNMITEKGGKADETIAYVQSLQPQVEEITQIGNQNANFEPTLNQDDEIVNPSVESSSRTKKRKLKSKLWDDFTKYEGEDGKELAKCNHCEKEFVGSSKSGTTHLKNHLERCKSKSSPGGADKSIETIASLTTPVVI